MAQLPIRIYGDPCLREKSRPIETIDDDVRQLVRDMAETLYADRGVGLAAPQVGRNVRLFVSDVDWVEDEGGKDRGVRNLKVHINPELIWESPDDESHAEGCLSLPEIEGDVFRSCSVKVRYQDETGAVRERRAEGLEARCIQHEIDHLDGVLFVDRMPFVKRRLLAGKLREIKKRSALVAT
ncbi:peptide deformylase [Candidatus Sumerlaeota bacterium]|nr:peptide deformylase [Candidatus Sumerlaeota bacterium]